MLISKIYQQKDPTLPNSVQVRIIKTEAKIRGKKESFWLATSLIDEKKYPYQSWQD
ncbi:MAG: hypothetical protein V1749_02375 [Candidatus Desantisbacteria bacterium]